MNLEKHALKIAAKELLEFENYKVDLVELECTLGDYNSIKKGDVINIIDKNEGLELKGKVKKVVSPDGINARIKIRILEQSRL